VNIQYTLWVRLTLVVEVEEIDQLPFHRAVFRLRGFVALRVGGSGLLAGNELVEGFFNQLGGDGIVGFSGPLSQHHRFVVVRPFFRPLAGRFPGR